MIESCSDGTLNAGSLVQVREDKGPGSSTAVRAGIAVASRSIGHRPCSRRGLRWWTLSSALSSGLHLLREHPCHVRSEARCTLHQLIVLLLFTTEVDEKVRLLGDMLDDGVLQQTLRVHADGVRFRDSLSQVWNGSALAN